MGVRSHVPAHKVRAWHATHAVTGATLNRQPTDREFHEANALRSQTDPEGALAELDARYHDDLPENTNCYLCGIEHAAIHPEEA